MSNRIRKILCILMIINIFLIVAIILMLTLFKEKNINFFNKNNLNYISYSLYSNDEVLKVLASNQIYDNSLLNDYELVIEEDDNILDSSYEDEILVNDTGKDYKYIKLTIAGYDAYMAVIYDPSKVNLITSASFNTGNSQQTAKDICAREGKTICINGGGFVDLGSGSDIPIGYIIKNSKIIWSDSEDNNDKEYLIGFDKNNKLKLVYASGNEALEMGIRDALQFGPFLIVDGETIDMTNDKTGGYSGAARVAIGQRKDGIVLFLVTDGMHGSGPTLKDIQDTFLKYGVYNAANLDGGASSQLVIESQLVNNPKNIYGQTIYNGRRIVSGFGY